MSFTSIEPATSRLHRSELAVPGSNTTFFEKAAQSAADVVFLDVEDAVAPDDKEQARKNIIQGLNEIQWGKKTMMVRINGLDALALTKLDVLDGLERIEICTSYRFRSRTLTEFPSDIAQLAACEPVYESMPGWSAPTRGVRRFADLPDAARRYVARLEEVSGVPAAIISTGSDREDTILREDVLRFQIEDFRLRI